MSVMRSESGEQMPAPCASEGCHKPYLSTMLRAIGLDVTYHRGRGDFLYYQDPHGREVEVLDMVGGFGSLLLGHSHPAIVATAQQLLSECRPAHVQGSHRSSAVRLAAELANRVHGDYCTLFANSGAEAVEAAMKHAMLATGSRTFLALEGAFHGKTLGALQLTANDRYGGPFRLRGIHVRRVRLNDQKHLASTFARLDRVAGFVFEPLLGEGGVRQLDAAFVARAAKFCAERNAPLIADECQTGLGRTGYFLASEYLGVRPDYIVLSKVLGGGIAKIAALLIRRDQYCDEFDLMHTSTFADDHYSCEVARTTLRLIDDSILAACRSKGACLLRGLNLLKGRYPNVVADVRGLGLMLGVEFSPLIHSRSFVLRSVSSQQRLLHVIAGYLLHRHNIRVAPTLSDPFTLRLQPSAFLSNEQIERFLAALDTVCRCLEEHDAPQLMSYLLDRIGPPPERPVSIRTGEKASFYDVEQRSVCAQSSSAARVAWLCHFIDANALKVLEPSFADMTFQQRHVLLDYLAVSAQPVVMNAVDIRSRTGCTAQLLPIALPVTSRWMKKWIDMRRFAVPRSLVQAGVDVAESLGCCIVALGQYTSIVTHNGQRLRAAGMGVTTGNSLSLALAIQAIERAERNRHWKHTRHVLAVVGAAGNIGSACAALLAPCYNRTILIGSESPIARTRLAVQSRHIPRSEVAETISALTAADVVVVATNAVNRPLGPEHFAPHAIVCDLSVPPSVREETAIIRPDLHVIKGGIARLPYGEDLGIHGFPLPQGLTYGCMAEGLLLGFEGICDTSFTGALQPLLVSRMEKMARRHGIVLAEDKTSCVLGHDQERPVHVDA